MIALARDEIIDELNRLGIVEQSERMACLREYLEYFHSRYTIWNKLAIYMMSATDFLKNKLRHPG